MLYNLIDNAVKFTFSGSVSIAATRLPVFHTGIVWVLFTVSDTGIGIPSSKLSDLFKPFPQTEGSYIRHNKGAGLGLPIVKRLVCLMNGTIAVASEESAGTTFYVSIPFRHATTTPETTTDVYAVQSPLAPAVCQVLVVEDDEVSQQIVTKQLLMAGYAVKVADNGKEALQRLAKDSFDLILMDIQMPVVDGVKATKLIRGGGATLGSNVKIPIVAVTAHAMPGDKEKFLAAGMNDYLSKPVDMAELLRVIENVMGYKEASLSAVKTKIREA